MNRFFHVKYKIIFNFFDVDIILFSDFNLQFYSDYDITNNTMNFNNII